jgi:hypothetical protein
MDTTLVVTELVFFSIVAGVVVLIVAGMRKQHTREQEHVASLSEHDRKTYLENKAKAQAEAIYGPLRPAMVCPHCKQKGSVHTKKVTHKAGVSGGKATAAVLTGGASLLAVGLSRKQDLTEAHCTNCNSTWHFA